MTQWFQRQTVAGRQSKIGNTTVTPQSEIVTLRWPNGGLSWSRPTAVLAEENQQTTRIPIIDITRLLVWMFWGFTLFFAIITVLLSIKHRRKNDERES